MIAGFLAALLHSWGLAPSPLRFPGNPMRLIDVPDEARVRSGRPRRFAPPRTTTAAILLTALVLAGCGEDEFQTPPDCGGTHLLLFSSDRFPGRYEVFLYDLDEGGFRLLTELNSKVADNLNPAITSDAQVIAFETNRGTTGKELTPSGGG